MRRSDACAFLTKIAQDELLDTLVSKDLLKARDIVICEPNKVLDVLATEEAKNVYSAQLVEYLISIYNNQLISHAIRTEAYRLQSCISNNSLENCTCMYLEQRCKNCPCFKCEKDEE